MPILYDVEHVTTYKYAKPVTFTAHRAMFLPRSAKEVARSYMTTRKSGRPGQPNKRI